MKTLFALTALLIVVGSTTTLAQELIAGNQPTSFESNSREIKMQMPSFYGGNEALTFHIQSSLVYPEFEKNNRIEGTVYLEFQIAEDGGISDVTVTKSVSPGLDKEALRIAEAMPNWQPASYNGKPQSVRYQLPVTFEINY